MPLATKSTVPTNGFLRGNGRAGHDDHLCRLALPSSTSSSLGVSEVATTTVRAEQARPPYTRWITRARERDSGPRRRPCVAYRRTDTASGWPAWPGSSISSSNGGGPVKSQAAAITYWPKT